MSLFRLLLVAIVLMAGCRWTRSATPTATPTPVEVAPTPRLLLTPTLQPSPASISTAQPAPVRIVTPVPVATPVSEGASVELASCCGLLAWVDADRLVVYDAPAGGSPGTWLVHVPEGQRRFLSPRFGLPSPAGTIAIPESASQRTAVLDLAGNVVDVITNSGALTWPSPDGRKVAWLERLPVRTPSSSVNPVMRLWIADLASGEQRPLLELQAASLTWLPDSRRLLIGARTPQGERPGIWIIDVDSGQVDVVVEGTFLYNVRLSPDGRRIGYVRALSGEPARDGMWVLDLESGETWRLPIASGFRWAGSGESFWVLVPGSGEQPDTLVLMDARSAVPLRKLELPGQVLNSVWETSPDGRWVAFWRLQDQHVVAVELAESTSGA